MPCLNAEKNKAAEKRSTPKKSSILECGVFTPLLFLHTAA
jgi:hypothetical protein